MECSLPPDKLSELVTELHTWSSRKKCIKRELLSLVGKLNFACWIIPAGRIFLWRLIDLGTTARLPHHHISLNAKVYWDVAWWLKYLCLEWPSYYSWPLLVKISWSRALHWCIWRSWFWHLLSRSLAEWFLALQPVWSLHPVEGALPHSSCLLPVGSTLEGQETAIPLW